MAKIKSSIACLVFVFCFVPSAFAGSGCTEADLIGLGVRDIQAGALGCDSYASTLKPETDDTYDIGSSSYQWKDIYIDGKAYIDGIGETLSPGTDDSYDLGTTSVEWKDVFVDGVAHIDTVDVDVAFGSDVALSINATDLGVQADTDDGSDDQTVKVCGGGGGTACDGETRGAWLVLEGADVGGAGVGGAVNLEGGAGDGTADVTIATNHDDADIILRGGTTQATRATIEGDTGDLILATGTLIQTEQQFIPASVGHVGAGAGFTTNNNTGMAAVAASQTGATFIVPVVGLKIGDTVSAFKVISQIESAGNTVTVDADLRKLTNAAADPTDASIGAITQISVTADTATATEKSGLAEVVASGEMLYVLVTVTTGASTDVQFLGIELTVLTGN